MKCNISLTKIWRHLWRHCQRTCTCNAVGIRCSILRLSHRLSIYLRHPNLEGKTDINTQRRRLTDCFGESRLTAKSKHANKPTQIQFASGIWGLQSFKTRCRWGVNNVGACRRWRNSILLVEIKDAWRQRNVTGSSQGTII